MISFLLILIYIGSEVAAQETDQCKPIFIDSVVDSTHHWQCGETDTNVQRCCHDPATFLEAGPQYIQFNFKSKVDIGSLKITSNVSSTDTLEWLESFQIQYHKQDSIWFYVAHGFIDSFGRDFSLKFVTTPEKSDLEINHGIYDVHHFVNDRSRIVYLKQAFKSRKVRISPVMDHALKPYDKRVCLTIQLRAPECNRKKVDPCKDSKCDQDCTPNEDKAGGYHCTCRDGFHLWEDKHTCITSRHCGEGLYPLSNLRKCYFINFAKKLTYQEAVKDCEKKDIKEAKLAVVNKKEISSWMADMMGRMFDNTQATTDFWVGFISRDPQCTGGNWSWVQTGSKDRKVQTEVYANYTLKEHQSCDEEKERSCGFVGYNNSEATGQMGVYNDYCYQKKAYICEKEITTGTCPDTWIERDNRCYWASSYHDRDTWHNAMSHCHRYFGSLLVLSDLTEWEFTKDRFLEPNKLKRNHLPLWVGANYNVEFSSFTWSDKSPDFSNVAVINKQRVPSWECGILKSAVKTNKGRFLFADKYFDQKIKGKNAEEIAKTYADDIPKLLQTRSQGYFQAFQSDTVPRKDSFSDDQLTEPLKCMDDIYASLGKKKSQGRQVREVRKCIDRFVKAEQLDKTVFRDLTKCVSGKLEGNRREDVQSCSGAGPCIANHYWAKNHYLFDEGVQSALKTCAGMKDDSDLTDIFDKNVTLERVAKSFASYDGSLSKLTDFIFKDGNLDKQTKKTKLEACYPIVTASSQQNIKRLQNSPSKDDKSTCLKDVGNENCQRVSNDVNEGIDQCLEDHKVGLYNNSKKFQKYIPFEECVVGVIVKNRENFGSDKLHVPVTNCILKELLPGYRCVLKFDDLKLSNGLLSDEDITDIQKCVVDYVSMTDTLRVVANSIQCIKTLANGTEAAAVAFRSRAYGKIDKPVVRTGIILRALARCIAGGDTAPAAVTLRSNEEAVSFEAAIDASPCEEKHHFICELLDPQVISNEPNYVYKTEPLTIHDAQGKCRNENGNLISLHTIEQFEKVKQDLEGYTGADWLIGLMDTEGNNNFDYWIDDSLVEMTAWAEGNPRGQGQRCVIMKRSQGWKWFSVSCNTPARYICDLGSVHQMITYPRYTHQWLLHANPYLHHVACIPPVHPMRLIIPPVHPMRLIIPPVHPMRLIIPPVHPMRLIIPPVHPMRLIIPPVHPMRLIIPPVHPMRLIIPPVHPMRLINGYYMQTPTSIISSRYETHETFTSYYGNSIENLAIDSHTFLQSTDNTYVYGGGWEAIHTNETAYVEVHFEEEMVVQGIITQASHHGNRYFDKVTLAYDLNGYIKSLKTYESRNYMGETHIRYTGNDLKQTSLIRIIGPVDKVKTTGHALGLRLEILAIPLKDVLRRNSHNLCQRAKHGCSHLCFNSRSSFICGCHAHYHLFTDGKACIPDVTCPKGSIIEDNECIEVVSGSVTVSAAESQCQKTGGTLATVRDPFSNLQIKKAISNGAHGSGCTKVMIGIKVKAGSSVFQIRFVDEEWIRFADFARTLPTSHPQDMIVYMSKAKDFHWDIAPSGNFRGCYVCQVRRHDCFMSLTTGILENTQPDGVAIPAFFSDALRKRAQYDFEYARMKPPRYSVFAVADTVANITLRIAMFNHLTLQTVTGIVMSGADSDGIFNLRVAYSPDKCTIRTDPVDFSTYTFYGESSNKNISKVLQHGIPTSGLTMYHFYKPFEAQCVILTYENPHHNQKTPIAGLAVELFGCPADTLDKPTLATIPGLCGENADTLEHGGGHYKDDIYNQSVQKKAYQEEKKHWIRCLFFFDCTDKVPKNGSVSLMCLRYCKSRQLVGTKCHCRSVDQAKFILHAQFDTCHVDTVCALPPCENKGTCTSRDGMYTCKCKDPYIGTNCTGIKVTKADIRWFTDKTTANPTTINIKQREFLAISIVIPPNVYDPTISMDFGDGTDPFVSKTFILLTKKKEDELKLRGVTQADRDKKLHGLFFKNTYPDVKNFKITIKVSNFDSEATINVDVTVAEKPGCKLSLSITNIDTDFKNANPYLESTVISFQARMVPLCSQEDIGKVTWKWTIGKLEPDHAFISELADVVTPTDIRTDISSITLPPWTLPPHMYYLYLFVNMNNGKQTEFKFGYLQVVTAPIVVSLDGGDERQIVRNKPLKLSVSVVDQSQNPVPRKFISTYKWKCDMNNVNAICDFVDALWPENKDNKDKIILPTEDAEINIPENHLSVQNKYTFSIVVTFKSGSTYTAKQTITAKSSLIPIMGITCKKNCGACRACVSPLNRIALEARCSNCPVMSEVGIRWAIHKQRIDINGQVHYEQLSLNWETATATKYDQQTLVIYPNILLADHVYRIVVHGLSQEGNDGTAQTNLEMAKRPKEGKCTVSPETGRALDTKFVVTCQNFTDPLGRLLTYKILLRGRTNAGPSIVLLFTGFRTPTDEFVLSQGDPDKKNQVIITVHVETTIGLYIEQNLTLTVNPLIADKDINKVVEKMDEIITGKDSVIDKKLAVDDDEGTASIVTLMIVSLNHASAQSASEKQVTSEASQEQKKKIHEKLVDALGQVKANNVEMIQRVALGNALIVQNTDELSDATAATALTNINKISSTFETISQHSESQDTIEVAGYLVDGLSSLMDRDLSTNASDKKTAEAAKNHSDVLLKSFTSLGDGLTKNLVAQEGPVKLDTDLVKMTVEKKYFYSLAGSTASAQQLKSKSGEKLESKFVFPQVDSFYDEDPRYRVTDVNNIVSIQSIFTDYNPYTYSKVDTNISSPILKFETKKADSTNLKLNDLNSPLEFLISLDKSKSPADVIHRKIVVPVIYDPRTNLTHKQMWIPSNNNFTIEAEYGTLVIIKANTNLVRFRAMIKQGTTQKAEDKVTVEEMELAGTDLEHDDSTTFDNRVKESSEYVLTAVKKNSKVYYGYVSIVPQDKQVLDIDALGGGVCLPDSVNCRWMYINVSMELFIEGKACVFWDKKSETWITEGCQVGSNTTKTMLHCLCYHLSSFTSGFLVLPNYVNPLDFSLFLTFFENPIVVMCVILVWCIYFTMLVIMRHMDRIDQTKTDIRIIDETQFPRYTYVIGVFTGWWRKSGTTSNVCFYLTGSEGRSMRHGLQDIERPRFESGDEDWFLLRTKRHLGSLQYITFWHDSSGEHPAWFLKEAIVKDLNENETYTFVYNDWLSVDRGSLSTIATIPAFTSNEICSNHKYQFWLNAVTKLRDGHLWLSIFVKPLYSTFTRVQRLSCGLCLLLTAMLTNIMFFGIPTDDPSDQVSAKGFQFSLTALAIGIESAIIMFPISFLTITLFTKLKPRQEVIRREGYVQGDVVNKALAGEDFEMPPANKTNNATSTLDDITNNAEDTCNNAGNVSNNADTAPLGLFSDPNHVHRKKKSNLSEAGPKKRRRKTHYDDDDPKTENTYVHSRRDSHKTVTLAEDPNKGQIRHKRKKARAKAAASSRSDYTYMSIAEDTYKSARSRGDRSRGERSRADRSRTDRSRTDRSKSPRRRKPRKSTVEQPTKQEDVRIDIDSQAVHNLAKAHEKRMRAKLEKMIYDQHEKKEDEKPKRDWRLPWYFVYVAWTVCILASLVSSYFVMIYGLKYGYDRSLEWIVAFFTSFFTSAGVMQPLKVILLAVIITMILRKTAAQATEQIDIQKARTPGSDVNQHDGIMASFQPLSHKQLDKLKERIVKHWQMNDLIKELFFYFTFIAVVIILVAGQRDISACYASSESAMNMFVLASDESSNSPMTVATVPDMWSVLSKVVYPNMYSMEQRDTSVGVKRKKNKKIYQKMTADTVSIVIGVSRIRQVRIRNRTCPLNMTGLPTMCRPDFNYRSQDTDSYTSYWQRKLTKKPIIATPWTYQTAWRTKTPPYYGKHAIYSGGGYSIDIPYNSTQDYLRLLARNNWIDLRTRAIFVDFTTYNPAMNLYSMITLIFELPATGAITPRSRIFTSKLYPYRSEFERFTIFVQAVFILYTLIFSITQYKRYKRLGRKLYFKDPWNVVEFCIIVMSCVAIGIFFQRLLSNKKLIKKIHDAAGLGVYISFYTAAGWDYALAYITAIITFVVIVKLFKLFQFNAKMSAMSETIRLSLTPVTSFLIVATVMMLAFAHFGVLFFGSYLEGYRDLSTSSLTLLNFALGVSEFYDLYYVNTIFGPLFFFGFVFFIQMLLLSILVTVILESFAVVQSDLSKVENKFELLEYIHGQVCLFLGIRYNEGAVKEEEKEAEATERPKDE